METNRNLLEYAESSHIPAALYGAGKYGRIALANIRKRYPLLEVKYFIDDNLSRNNRDVEGIQVMPLKSALENLGGGKFFIVISNYYVRETYKKLEKAGLDLADVYFSNELLIEYADREDFKKKADELREVYGYLEDYESKLIYKTVVEARLIGNIDALARTCSVRQYFPEDILNVAEEEVFVDGGAFDGDTIDGFIDYTKGRFKYIYAFEPDECNYRNLADNHQQDNIRLFPMGLYDEDEEITFLSGKGGSSQIQEDGEDKIRVCAFDHLDVPDKKVTFVKMDIEGSELKALQGMEKTIQECKPKLAICIYHKFEDLWEIPLLIKKFVPDYRLYIRNYTTYLDEIVLYAVI